MAFAISAFALLLSVNLQSLIQAYEALHLCQQRQEYGISLSRYAVFLQNDPLEYDSKVLFLFCCTLIRNYYVTRKAGYESKSIIANILFIVHYPSMFYNSKSAYV